MLWRIKWVITFSYAFCRIQPATGRHEVYCRLATSTLTENDCFVFKGERLSLSRQINCEMILSQTRYCSNLGFWLNRISPGPLTLWVYDGRPWQAHARKLNQTRSGFLTSMVGNDVKRLVRVEYRCRPKSMIFLVLFLVLTSGLVLSWIKPYNKNQQGSRFVLLSFKISSKSRSYLR